MPDSRSNLVRVAPNGWVQHLSEEPQKHAVGARAELKPRIIEYAELFPVVVIDSVLPNVSFCILETRILTGHCTEVVQPFQEIDFFEPPWPVCTAFAGLQEVQDPRARHLSDPAGFSEILDLARVLKAKPVAGQLLSEPLPVQGLDVGNAGFVYSEDSNSMVPVRPMYGSFVVGPK